MKRILVGLVLAVAVAGCGREVGLPAPQCEERDVVWVCSNDADLRSLDLHAAQLSFAELEGVNLQGVNLEGARLDNANLSHANLEGANLS
ncbi:MAG: pentapeptide repeat-containing protein, partial [Ilumatobacteraceae bacterium]|nr:pentapeptide repeat-containing protein [Ilumatobacteraceae bacterium]